METCERGSIAFVVFDQPAASCCPGEGSFDDPAPWQQNEAVFRFGQLDDFEGNTLLSCGFGGLFAGIPLIDVSERNALASGLLNGFGKAADPGLRRGRLSARSSTLAGVTCRASRWPRVSTAIGSLEPRLRLAPS